MPTRNRFVSQNYEDFNYNYQQSVNPKRRRNRKRRSQNRQRSNSMRSATSTSGNEQHGYQTNSRSRGESVISQSNASILTNDRNEGENRSRGRSLRQKPLRWYRDRLSREIWKFYLQHSQTPELLTRKHRLRDALHKILTTHFPNYEVDLHIVGSTANGLANNKSDVDICLVLSEIGNKESEEEKKEQLKDTSILEKLMPSPPKEKNPNESSPEKTEVGIIVNYEESEPIDKSNLSSDSLATTSSNGSSDPSIPMLEMVKEVLKEYSFVTAMQIIAAKVPILKFVDRISGIEVTLNVNKLVSIRNTHLVHDYTKLDWRLQPLVMVIKAWASDHGINDAYNKSISSYSLVLMVIHYLQYTVDPPVLPCLQEMLPINYSPTMDIKSIKMTKKPIRWKSENQSSLKELLIGFLDYYSYGFCYSKDAISIRLGRTIPKHVAQRYKSEDNAFSHWKYLCIEEPFNRSNTARSVYDEVTFERILSVFRVSHYTIRRYPYLDSIMTGKQYTNHYNVIDEYINAK